MGTSHVDELPLVWIVVPVYNAEKTLSKCLDSLLSQTYPNWKACLIDDRSTDNSFSVMMAYAQKDDRFCCLQNPRNIGASATRNHGLQGAQGAYTAFLDSDDWWSDDFLEQMVGTAETYHADIVQCAFMLEWPGGASKPEANTYPDVRVFDRAELAQPLARMMSGISMNHVCRKLVRHELLEGLCFSTMISTAEDLALSFELLMKTERIVFIPQPLYHYYRHSEGLTGSSLSFRQKWIANNIVADMMLDGIRNTVFDTFRFRTLARVRPFRLLFSKAGRLLRDKWKRKPDEERTPPLESSLTPRNHRFEQRTACRMDLGISTLVCLLPILVNLILKQRLAPLQLFILLLEPLLIFSFMRSLEAYRHFDSFYEEKRICILLSNFYAWCIGLFLNLCLLRNPWFLLQQAVVALLQGVLMLLANHALCRYFTNERFYRKPSLLVVAAPDGSARLRRLKYGILSAFDAWYVVLDENDPAEFQRIKGSIAEYDALCIFDNIWGHSYEELLVYAMKLKKEVYTVPRIADINIRHNSLTHFDDIPVLYLENYEMSLGQRFWKRVLDIVVALIGLLVSFIPMAVIAICIKLDSPGPVFYRQERYTINKRPFRIIKFRTMVVDAEKLTGPILAQKEDPRVTRVGRILRKYRLDELPQIYNILKGDMSLVGPRPERPFFVERYEKEIPQYDYRFAVKAGLTALSHVYGRYSTYIRDRTYYDLRYIAEYSFLLDIRILLLTSKTLFLKNAAEGEDEFKDIENRRG